MQATIASKGQITIPIQIRNRLNLLPGQRLEFDELAPFIKATKAVDRNRMQLACGVLTIELATVSVVEALDGLRGSVDEPFIAQQRSTINASVKSKKPHK